jgi:predicted nucleotidyltransferase
MMIRREETVTIESLKNCIQMVAEEYPIKKAALFGSRAERLEQEDSDVDLIMEFSKPVSLLTLSMLRLRLEEMLEVDVDIIHGPVKDTDLIEVGKVIELYAA